MSIFNSKQKIKIPYSDHDLSHNFSGTFNPGSIIPILTMKIIPGDIVQIASTPDIRTQPLVSPFFTNTEVDIRYFYCRNMLLWPVFDQYIINQPRVSPPSGTWTPPVHPYLTKLTGARGSLFDYIYGASDPNTSYEGLDSLPCRMYNMVYSEYYRDEFLQAISVPSNNGADNPSSYSLRQACYRKDYFTKSFPFTQIGNPVSLRGRVVLDNNAASQHYVDMVGNLATAGTALFANNGPNTQLETSGTPGYPVNMDPNNSLGVNIDIRDLRRANAVQKFLERSAVNGNRYAEYMLSHFGVKTADNSAFRPQYLGGGRVRLNVNPVEQTAPSNNAPLATQGGRGRIVGMVGMNHSFAFKEYGWLMALMFIRPEAEYVGGINKQFFADGDRLENYWLPIFQNIGMEEVNVREIAYPSAQGNYDPKSVFSYQERGFQYKTMPNTVHGEFAGGSMRSWVAVRNFADLTSAPQLNSAFVQVPVNAFQDQAAVNGYPLFFGSIRHNIIARRAMQYRANYKL